MKRIISVWPATHQVTVQPNHSVRHSAVYFEIDHFAFIGSGNIQFLSIPADALNGQAAHATTDGCRITFIKRSADCPVMWQIHLLPGMIIKIVLYKREIAAGVAGRTLMPVGRVFYKIVGSR